MLSLLDKVWIQLFIFWIVLVGLFFFLGFNDVFFSGPFGTHFMRQTDSLSFASQYFNKGFLFFEPKLFNLKNIDGNAACEFPIIYYITALSYTVFGKNVITLKLLHFMIISLGVFSVFRLSYLLLKDYVYAVLISLFLFTSTVFNYYSFNYLPDAPALGFTLIGWFLVFQFLNSEKEKHLIGGFVLFTLGSLIKVTYSINPLSIILIALFSLCFKKHNLISKIKSKRIITCGVLALILVFIWNFYVLYYNEIYDSNSFNTTARPIWDMSNERIAVVWDHVLNHWNYQYFAHFSLYFIYVAIFFSIISLKKSSVQLSMLTLILFVGSACYFFLFYALFKHHDYYFLTFFPFIVFIIINGLKNFQNITNRAYLHYLVKLFLVIAIFKGINYSSNKLASRYQKTSDKYVQASVLIQKNMDLIQNLNLPKNSKFIIGPDLCQNGGLYFLDKMGWNIAKEEDLVIDKINDYKNIGADYLLINSNEHDFLNTDNIDAQLILDGNGIEIFKLSN